MRVATTTTTVYLNFHTSRTYKPGRNGGVLQGEDRGHSGLRLTEFMYQSVINYYIIYGAEINFSFFLLTRNARGTHNNR